MPQELGGLQPSTHSVLKPPAGLSVDFGFTVGLNVNNFNSAPGLVHSQSDSGTGGFVLQQGLRNDTEQKTVSPDLILSRSNNDTVRKVRRLQRPRICLPTRPATERLEQTLSQSTESIFNPVMGQSCGSLTASHKELWRRAKLKIDVDNIGVFYGPEIKSKPGLLHPVGLTVFHAHIQRRQLFQANPPSKTT